MRSNTISRSFDTHRRSATAPAFGPLRRPVSLPMVAALLGAIDAALLLGAGFAASIGMGAPDAGAVRLRALVVLLGTLVAADLLRAAGLYRPAATGARGSGVVRAACGWTITMALAAAVAGLTGTAGLWLAAWFAAGLVILVLDRWGMAILMARWRRRGRLCRAVAVLGAGPLGEDLLDRLDAAGEASMRVAGVYDDLRPGPAQRCRGHRVAGSIDDLVDDIRRGIIDEVMIALPHADDQRLAVAALKLCPVPVAVRVCAGALGATPRRARIGRLGDLTLIDAVAPPLAGGRGIAKAIEDRIIAAAALAVLGLPMLLIALAIRLDSPGPVLFRQRRTGLNNRLIEVLKFRTMYEQVCDPDAESLTRRNDPRVTRLGAFLRRTMLDELPQFINVLRGEMSIVGPRPHALSAKAGGLLYADAVPDYDARHRVKPGITGWAQVNGWRGTTDTVEQIEKRIECDLHYVEHWSVRRDLAIIARTVLLMVQSLRRR